MSTGGENESIIHNDETKATTRTRSHYYMTICPSGLENIALNAIHNEITLNNYKCHDIQILNEQREKEVKVDNFKRQLYNQIQKKKNKKCKRTEEIVCSTINRTTVCDTTQTQIQLGIPEQDEHENDHYLEKSHLHGTIQIKDENHHIREICIGYHDDETIISSPGGLEGKKLITFKTNAPSKLIANIRPIGCGPLLAVVLISSDFRKHDNDDHDDADDVGLNKDYNNIFPLDKSLDESVVSFTSFMSNHVGSANYTTLFTTALELWCHHVNDVWLQSKDIHDFQCLKKGNIQDDDSLLDIANLSNSMRDKMNGNEICRYRVSSIRSYTKDYSYKREDIIPHLIKHLIPNEIKVKSDFVQSDSFNSGRSDTRSTCSKPLRLAVDLKNYDFELVLFVHGDMVNIAISLCPYQYLGARSFSSGKLPPDIAQPYITGEVSQTIVRLRPSISSLLCYMSKIEKGDIILDPCAGIGSIPVEASLLNCQMTCYGIGGDIAIFNGGDNQGLDRIITNYIKRARNYQVNQSCSGGNDLLSWDASSIPVRESTIDCIISDLPFGQKCMSSKKLQTFLPLLFSECARILRKKTGRMTLLCGSSYKYVLDAISQQRNENDSNTDLLFEVTSIFPVNIGGLSGWIVQAIRNDIEFSPLKNYHIRHRKMTGGREQQQIRWGVKRRIQS